MGFGQLGQAILNTWGNSFQSSDQSALNFGSWLNKVRGNTENNEFNALEAEKTRDFNSAEAAKNREWEEYMSNTAYQRAVADMKAAGINPAMAAGQGGASTPSASPASANSAHAASPNSPNALVGLIGKAAAVAIGKGLEAKFTNSALKAADNHELVTARIKHMANMEKQGTAKMAQQAKQFDDKMKFAMDKLDYDAIEKDRRYGLDREKFDLDRLLKGTQASYLHAHNYRWKGKKDE